MDAETQRWVIAASFVFTVLAVGVALKESKRISKNYHSLRNWIDAWTKDIETRVRRIERRQDKDESR